MKIFIVGFTLSLVQIAAAQTPEDILLESRNNSGKSADLEDYDSDRVQLLLRNAISNSVFKPTETILAVNALHALGKKRSIEEIEKHLGPPGKQFWSDDHIFVILRLLFEPINPKQQFPVPRNTAPSIHDKKIAPDWPLNPVELVGGIPFKYQIAMGFSGSFEHFESHLDFVKQACVLRDRLLTPSVNPIVAANNLCESQKIRRMERSDKEQVIQNIRQQAVSMLPKELRSKDWGELSREVPLLNLTWNQESGFQAPPIKN